MNLSHHTSILASGNKLHVWRGNVTVGAVTIDWTEGSHVWFWQWTYPGSSVMGSADSLEAAQTQAEAALTRYVALSNVVPANGWETRHSLNRLGTTTSGK